MIFKIANIKSDYNILLKAKEDSEEYLKNNDDTELISLLKESTDLN